MSAALRKKFLRLWGQEQDVTGAPGPWSRAPPGSPAPPVPVKLLVEPVPVALQGVRRETWGQRRLNARRLWGLHAPSRPLPLLHILETVTGQNAATWPGPCWGC